MYFIILIIVIALLIIEVIKLKRYAKQLFSRALSLELHLIDIYEQSSPDLKEKIEHIVKNIKPL